MSAGEPDGSVPAAPAQGQAAAPSSAQPVAEAAPVLPEAVPAADEPQASTLAMQHTPADGNVGQHYVPICFLRLLLWPTLLLQTLAAACLYTY